ncbi:MAG: hypothetical protein H9901_02050 [Candidatus Paralactobacillus gallistercoris]|uniref:Uncharacterized protein n=1 Tax=Candidatus Paralactobacillus gallistercoris TaxID=2838724 RepID=A0A948TJK3_9LACO|nr:hypothetical protein [Candidatus Paralactobacillus gallistercoris]
MVKVNFFIDENDDEHTDFYIKQMTPQLQTIANQLQNKYINIYSLLFY